MKDLMFPVGISNFEKIREGGYYYIDKTNLISELHLLYSLLYEAKLHVKRLRHYIAVRVSERHLLDIVK